MAIEIERKFLVTDDGWRSAADQGRVMRQGYLANTPSVSVRVREAGDAAWITVKGATSGASRAEFEYAIPTPDAEAMLTTLCADSLIDKTRYRVAWHGHTWEVDVFGGDNAGLVVAELELESEQQDFELPPWVGPEVTHDPRYFNASLVRSPWRSWPDNEP